MARPKMASPPSVKAGPELSNRILAQLPASELDRIRPDLMPVTLEVKQTLWEPNQPIGSVYFPIDAVVSILAETDEGQVEVGTVGNEGLVGLPVFLGAGSFPGVARVQISGQAQRIGAEAFRRAAQDSQLRNLLQRYTLGFLTQVSQGTACNRAHSAEQRLARWLLIVRDRVGRNNFPLTQEFMGQMLGVRRATVSETAGALQKEKLISYSRGVVTIQDPARLENVSCECYHIVRDEFDRLLGTPKR